MQASLNAERHKPKIVHQHGVMVHEVPYQQLVGCSLYLVQGTRPDIAFAVTDVSRFNHNHGASHWKAVKRILRYLQGYVTQRWVTRTWLVTPIPIGLPSVGWRGFLAQQATTDGRIINN